MRRINQHPILQGLTEDESVTIYVDGIPMKAIAGEPIASALFAAGIRTFRFTPRRKEPRGFYCGIGQCTDCMMQVDGVANVRTCVTPVTDGMQIRTQNPAGGEQPCAPPM